MRTGLGSWIIAAAVLVAAALSPEKGVAADSPALTAAIDTLRASSEELKREDAAYRAALAGAKISGREQSDYAEFVATLRLRVFEQCETVRSLGGEEALQGFECVRMARQQTIAAVPASAVQTDEEKRATMNARLNELEGDIDESLMKRQQTIRQTAARSGGGAGGGGGGGGAAGGAASSGGGAQAGGQSAGGQNSGASGGDSGAGSNTGQSTPAAAGGQTARRTDRQTPTDGGDDDDVVARQLREAAEKETDPVLKEKLWAEYRKYREAKR